MMTLLIKIAVLMLVSSTLFVSPILAKENREPVSVVLAQKEVVHHDYFAAGDSVTISGTVNGDAYVAGGSVFIDGTIQGDLLVAGGSIQIRGAVKNDVRAAGGSITLLGPVGGNVTLGGGNVLISPQAKIGGSLLAGAGMLDILGQIGKGVTAGAGTLTINNSIGGDIAVGVGQLTLNPKANLAGNLTYWSEQQASIADGAVLTGEVTYHYLPRSNSPSMSYIPSRAFGMITAGFFVLAGIGFLTTFLLGLALIAFFPRFSEKAVISMQKYTWAAFGLGIATVVIVPIVAVSAALTIIGLPLSVVLLVSLGMLCFVGHIYAGLFIGKRIIGWFKKEVHYFWQLVTGLFTLYVLMCIPILGWLVHSIFVLIGIGAALSEKHAVYRNMRTRHLI